jgi:hypothetical protein
VLEELDRVLGHPKLERYYTEEERTRFVALLMALSEMVGLPETIPRTAATPTMIGSSRAPSPEGPTWSSAATLICWRSSG